MQMPSIAIITTLPTSAFSVSMLVKLPMDPGKSTLLEKMCNFIIIRDLMQNPGASEILSYGTPKLTNYTQQILKKLSMFSAQLAEVTVRAEPIKTETSLQYSDNKMARVLQARILYGAYLQAFLLVGS